MSAIPRGPGPALRFPRWPAEGGARRSLRPRVPPHLALLAPVHIKKGAMGQMAAPFRIKATGESSGQAGDGRAEERQKRI